MTFKNKMHNFWDCTLLYIFFINVFPNLNSVMKPKRKPPYGGFLQVSILSAVVRVDFVDHADELVVLNLAADLVDQAAVAVADPADSVDLAGSADFADVDLGSVDFAGQAVAVAVDLDFAIGLADFADAVADSGSDFVGFGQPLETLLFPL